MKKFVFICSAILLGGCAASSEPQFINGNYYMGGDSNCSKYRMLSESRIMCINRGGEDMGYRDAMTSQQLQMYQFDKTEEAQGRRDFSKAMSDLNKTIRDSTPKSTNTNCYRTYGNSINCTSTTY